MGEKFGKYELVASLAEGGMAQTFRARMTAEAGVTKEVVIKKVLPALAEDQAFITDFINEARISASLSHGNIAQVFDFGSVDGEYFIAMEWVEGRSLGQMLRRAREVGFARIPVPVACFLTIETLKGLHYAHTRLGSDGQPLQIVHRDISPENILVGFEGQTKVVDFGVAKATLPGRKETEPGLVKGKYLYFSPEQALAQPLDARSDVFAVGVVLYRLLCGELPFAGQEHQVLRAILDGRCRPAAVANPELPSAVAVVVTRAMATDRARRYASALEMQEELAGFLNRQHPSLTGELVRDWMQWLFRPELEAQGRKVSSSAHFEAALKGWRLAERRQGGAPRDEPIVSTATPQHGAAVEAAVVAPARWPWRAGAAVIVLGLAGGALAGKLFGQAPPVAADDAAATAASSPTPEQALARWKVKIAHELDVLEHRLTNNIYWADLNLIRLQLPHVDDAAGEAELERRLSELRAKIDGTGTRPPSAVPVAAPAPPEPAAAAPLPDQPKPERDRLLAEARAAIEGLDWQPATELLQRCRYRGAPCPESTRLLAQMDQERGNKLALIAAGEALDANDLGAAHDALRRASETQLLARRYQHLNLRYLMAVQLQATNGTGAAFDPFTNFPRVSKADLLLEDARYSMKKGNTLRAQSKLEACVKLEPSNAECHQQLALVYGKLGKNEDGAKEYREFIKYSHALGP